MQPFCETEKPVLDTPRIDLADLAKSKPPLHSQEQIGDLAQHGCAFFR
jgi:hypothetical protein